jgi:hypothetical protein
VRLTVLVDVIAIAAGIAIILPAVDRRAENAAENGTGDRARARLDSRKNRTGDGAASGTERRASDRVAGLRIVAVLAVVVIAVVITVRVVPILVRIS